MSKLTFTARQDKVTKGAIRFAETCDKESQAIRTIYIRKFAVDKLGNPDEIMVTIESK